MNAASELEYRRGPDGRALRDHATSELTRMVELSAAGGSRAIHPRVLIDGHEKIRVAGWFDPGSDSSEPADAAFHLPTQLFQPHGPAPAHHPLPDTDAIVADSHLPLASAPNPPSNSISSRTYNSPALTVGPHPRLRQQVHDRVRHRARRQRHHHRYHR
jgi:hypothetical protein